MSNDPVGRRLVDRYRLDSLIATGGMAQVWTAHDELLNREVAVKILHAHLARDESFVRRFRREALAAARLNHPKIVAIYDSISDGGSEAIVMQLVRGETLRTRLDERRSLSPTEAVSIGVDVAEALQTAHDAGIVHRDVKPANILLTADGQVLVADFGIAKAGDTSDLTRTGALIGTAKYLSPEQVQGETIDAQTDVYALGVVLYEMLTGRPPFAADSDLSTALARVSRDPLLPRQIKPGLPRRVEDIVMKAMARQRVRRYGSAAELRAALLNVDTEDDEPKIVEPDDDGTTASFAASERTWLIPTAMIATMALMLGIAGWAFGRTDPGREFVNNVLDPVLGANIEPDESDGSASGDDESASATDDGDDTPEPTLAEATFTDIDLAPDGGGGEKPETLEFLSDGDPSIGWRTHRYNEQFPKLKPGVGVAVSGPTGHTLVSLDLTMVSTEWSAEIYTAPFDADGIADRDLEEWRAVGSPTVVDGGSGTQNLDLDMARPGDQSILIWFTQLAPLDEGGFMVEVGEIELFTITPS